MEQLRLINDTKRWTVTDLTHYLRQMLEADIQLQDIWVQGEISNLSRPSSGHIYFTLKDSGASLRCVMWRDNVALLRFTPEDGIEIEAYGYISIYETGGQYQLYADVLRPFGEGALFREFLRRKTLLEAEGLFDAARKRSIPERPSIIGVVTSPTSAALRDIINTIRRRYPLAEVIISPSAVQGEEAPASLIVALQNLNRIVKPDVILLARGGGSIEDLWAFNDERVVRAIVASQVPVITGIGHETDFTLADFASDLRAPTPTAAAELATPLTVLELQNSLTLVRQKLHNIFSTIIECKRSNVKEIRNLIRLYSPLRKVQSERQRLDELNRRGNKAQDYRLRLEAERLRGLKSRLQAINPLAVLKRGYAAITKKVDGKLVVSRLQVIEGDDLRLCVQDGEFNARVTENA